AGALKELESIIDNTKRNIADDRRKTEQLLTSLQQGFASNESVQRMLPEQKTLAQQMQQQLAQINEARRQYNQAVDAGVTDNDTQTRGQIVTLQAGIEARRKQLADQQQKVGLSQNQQAALRQKQTELTR